LKAEIKTTAEKQMQGQADQKFLNDATDYLIKNTKFDLPAEFLKRWLQMTSEKEMSFDEAVVEYRTFRKRIALSVD
jgi:trigger factor